MQIGASTGYGAGGGGAALLRPRGAAVLGAALVFAAAGLVSDHALARPTFLLAAVVLAAAAGWIWLLVRRGEGQGRRLLETAARLAEHDPVPTVLTGRDRLLLYANPAAARVFEADRETLLTGVLDGEVANAGRLLFELENQAAGRGRSSRHLPRPDGGLDISVQEAGAGLFLWRIAPREVGPEDQAPQADVPVIRADEAGRLLDMNAAARALLGDDPVDLDTLCTPAPLRPGQVNDIHTPEGPKSRLLACWTRADGRRDLYLFPDTICAAETGAGAGEGPTFFEALPVPLLKLSDDGLIQQSNAPARDLLGIDSGEGRRLGDLLEGPGRPMRDWLADAVAGRGTVHPETMRVRREDREVFAQVSLTPTADAGGPVLLAVLTDATSYKSLQEQFAQSQKMQAIGQLAGGVAHDFNNLLTAISGHCDLLLLRHDQEDSDYADLMQISQNANRAAALVSQLLAYSRKQTLRPERVDMRNVLSDLTHLLNRLVGEKVTLSVRNAPELWSVRADKRQLEQVLMNLVVNARDAMPDGGNIRVTTANRLLEAPMRRGRATVAPGRYVEIRVADQGAGIPPDKLEKVFEPFYTTKRPGEGTGLGLSTVYGIMKQTGGFIFAESRPDEGAEFLLLLPAHETADRPEEAARDLPARSPRSEGVVLLVEDEAPVRAFASRALKMRGLSVLEAASAEEALEVLEDDKLKVDVFVTDVIMPGLDGPSWVRAALKDRPETKVVFVSGYAPETFADTEAEIAHSVFLPKPFSLTELTETVQKQMADA